MRFRFDGVQVMFGRSDAGMPQQPLDSVQIEASGQQGSAAGELEEKLWGSLGELIRRALISARVA
jgi:hypothetical protein